MEESRESCVDRGQEPDKETVELLRLIEKYPVVILTLLVSPHIHTVPTMTTKCHTVNLIFMNYTLWYISILIYPDTFICLSDYRIWFATGRHPWQGVHWVCWRQFYQTKKVTNLISV